MPYRFESYEDELKPNAGGRRGGQPPRKHTGAALLDAPPPSGKLGFLPRLIARLRSYLSR